MIQPLLQKKQAHLTALKQLHILLAEDDLLNAKLVSILFAQHGLKLQLAKNGLEAVEKIQTNDFDMVLMDMEMPVMNGYQATTIIRQQLKNNIPIIALTAHALPGEKEKCLLYGMNDYVTKPVQPDILFEAMYNATCSNEINLPKEDTFTEPLTAADDKVCNMDYLQSITRGNKKNIHNIVSVFFKETRKELAYLNKAIQKTNYPDINDISHKIKSAFSILGISILEPVFAEMELLSSNTSPINKIQQLNTRINVVFKQARAEMKGVQ